MNPQIKGNLYAIFSGLLYGFVGYLGISIMRQGYSLGGMLFWRFLIASVFLFFYLKLQRKKIDFSLPLIISAFFYCISAGLYFASTQYICTGTAMVVFFCYPIIIGLINLLFYSKKLSKIYLTSFLLLLVGLTLLIQKDDFFQNVLGLFLAFISALTYAFYIIWSKQKVMANSYNIAFNVCTGSSIILIGSLFFESNNIIPGSIVEVQNIILMAIFCTALPIILLLESLKYISTEKASILSVLEPICVMIIGVVFLNEQVSFTQFIGIIAILTSTILALYS